jgi:AcrR family transcriptional regulator
VVAAALRVVAAQGFAGVTMRRVAAEVGGGASTLYWHVRDKGQLLDLLVDRLVGEIAVPPDGPWSERLRGFAHDSRRVLRRYPGLAQVILERGAAGPAAVRMAEACLGVLAQAGLDEAALWAAYHTLLTYITGFVLGETWPRDDDGGGRQAATSAYLASLPPTRFPNISAANRNVSWDDDSRFDFGLGLLVDALGRGHQR